MTTKHNHTLVFGRREAGCARCSELNAGAAPIRWNLNRYNARRNETQELLAIRAHFDSHHHTSGGCGPVCTFGDW